MRGTPLIFYHSINRKPLVMKVNRDFLYLAGIFCFLLAFSGRFISIVSDVLAIALFLIAVFVGRKISAVDPQIMEVYRRHRTTKDYYPPISGIHAWIKPLKPSVPFYEGKS